MHCQMWRSSQLHHKGKGPVDGIGAAKRHVWNMVKTRNATSFTSASEAMSNVEVIEMTSEMINNTNKAGGLDDVFKNAVTPLCYCKWE